MSLYTSSESAPLSRLRKVGRSLAGSAYDSLYLTLVGTHPNLRPWHFQWLGGRALYAALHAALRPLGGQVLDVGCGDKPYEGWIPGVESYFGIDVAPGPKVDAIIEPGERWPVPDDGFDLVLCTQVLEHVRDLEASTAELVRVVKPGGCLIVSVPFIYSEHGSPHDYRRFSRYGITGLFEDRLEVLEVIPLGGIGSSLAVALLNWVQITMTSTNARKLALVGLLPFWMALSVVVNLTGLALDRLDRTGLFYGDVLLLGRKPQE